jgi:hypothetical protein
MIAPSHRLPKNEWHWIANLRPIANRPNVQLQPESGGKATAAQDSIRPTFVTE